MFSQMWFMVRLQRRTADLKKKLFFSWTKSCVFTLIQLDLNWQRSSCIASYEAGLPIPITWPHMPPIRSGGKRGSKLTSLRPQNIRGHRYESGKVNISQIGDMRTLKETSLDQCTSPRGFFFFFKSGPLRLAPPWALLSLSLPALRPLSHPSHLQRCSWAAPARPAACSGIHIPPFLRAPPILSANNK